MEGEKGTVCVTGGGGYVASWLIMRLLEHGYSVRATARLDPKFKEDVSYLKSLPIASQRLQILDADLTKPETFRPAIQGCIGVFHVAHLIDLEGKLPEDFVVKTSLEGTLGILKACAVSKTVRKVVYTSSAAAAMIHPNISSDKEVDENQWTDVDFCRSLNFQGSSYAISKTITEREALKFAEEHGLELVTLLPSFIAGPFFSRVVPECISIVLCLLLGNADKCEAMSKMSNLVHIDDIIATQIFLFECPKAKGRYICSSTDITIHKVVNFFTLKYPELQIHTSLLEKMGEQTTCHLSSKKLLGLGFEFKYGLEDIIDGAIKCCKDKCFL